MQASDYQDNSAGETHTSEKREPSTMRDKVRRITHI